MVASIVRFAGLLAAASVGSLAWGREVPDWEYDRLAAQADVIAICELVSSQPAKFDFENVEPWAHLVRVTVFGLGPKIRAALGAEVSTFRPIAVLKGSDKDTRDAIRVLHVSLVGPLPDELENGPHLFRDGLGKTATKEKREGKGPKYLLFVRHGKDGQFEPVTGQFDGAYSVRQLRNLVYVED